MQVQLVFKETPIGDFTRKVNLGSRGLEVELDDALSSLSLQGKIPKCSKLSRIRNSEGADLSPSASLVAIFGARTPSPEVWVNCVWTTQDPKAWAQFSKPVVADEPPPQPVRSVVIHVPAMKATTRQSVAASSQGPLDPMSRIFELIGGLAAKTLTQEIASSRLEELLQDPAAQKLTGNDRQAFDDAVRNVRTLYGLSPSRFGNGGGGGAAITPEMIAAYRSDLMDMNQSVWGGWMEADAAAHELNLSATIHHDGLPNRPMIARVGPANGRAERLVYNGVHYRAWPQTSLVPIENDGGGHCLYYSLLRLAGRPISALEVGNLRRQVNTRLSDAQIRHCLSLLRFENNQAAFVGKALGKEFHKPSGRPVSSPSPSQPKTTSSSPLRGHVTRPGYWECGCMGPGSELHLDIEQCDTCGLWRPEGAWKPVPLLARTTLVPSMEVRGEPEARPWTGRVPPPIPSRPSSISLPTLEKWKEDSSVKKHFRSQSSIGKVDTALGDWWKAFSKGDKPGCLAGLDALEKALQHYITWQKNKHYAAWRLTSREPSKRVPAAERLLGLLPTVRGELATWDHPLSPATRSGNSGHGGLLEIDPHSIAALRGVESGSLLRIDASVSEKADALAIDNGFEQGLVLPDAREPSPPPLSVAEAMKKLMAASKKDPKALRKAIAASHLYILSGGRYDKDFSGADFFFDYAGTSESAISAVAATIDASLQNAADSSAGPMAFLTTSDWTLGPECILGLMTIAQTFRAIYQGKLGDTKVKAALNLVKAGANVAKSGATMANAIANMVHGPGTQAATAVGTVAQLVAAPAGLVSGVLSLYGEHEELSRLSSVSETLGGRLDQLMALDRKTFVTLALTPGVPYLIGKINGKLGKMKLRSKASIAGASVCTAGSAFTTLTLFGVMNCWNPAGWVAVGTGLVVATVSLGYKPARRLYKQNKLDRQRGENVFIPSWLKTTGDWHRFRVADLVLRASLLDPSLSESEWTAGQALAWVLFGGANYASACATAVTLGYPGIMRLLKTCELPVDGA
ncbi:hypothetical protein [Hyalangium versicolor]|uniref:hypothetical protein n=1 Tax=Hyalangium versicolor TaxID=2861190 RepID=UPI001CCA9708|nr:hypothetical protein [Hyalangium versicolor]